MTTQNAISKLPKKPANWPPPKGPIPSIFQNPRKIEASAAPIYCRAPDSGTICSGLPPLAPQQRNRYWWFPVDDPGCFLARSLTKITDFIPIGGPLLRLLQAQRILTKPIGVPGLWKRADSRAVHRECFLREDSQVRRSRPSPQ